MAEPQPVDPVKLLVAVLWTDLTALAQALREMETWWGPVDFTGKDIPFDVTDYYVPEMGGSLRRRLITFERLVPPESIVAAKQACNRLEESLARDGRRVVNLDVGYLDHSKIVLASMKFAGQKIHLGEGVYADMIARYRNGRYCPFEWTFPDFRDGRYDEQLAVIRRTFLQQLKELHRAT